MAKNVLAKLSSAENSLKSVMKRTFNDRKDPSFRLAAPGSFIQPLMYCEPVYRPQNETSFVQSSNINTIFQSIRSSSSLAFTNQIGLRSAGVNPGLNWSGGLSQIPEYSRYSRLQSTTMCPSAPGCLSWRNAWFNSEVNNLQIPGIRQQFQESQSATAPPLYRARNISNGKHVGNISKLMIRKWDMLPESKTSSLNDFKFSIVSYNTLSDKLLYDNMFLYEECFEQFLKWEFRKDNLLKEILDFNADILCLQEIDALHYEDWFQPKLREAGYSGIYNQRTGGKPDGCVIFYRTAKFTMVKKKLVKYYTSSVPVLGKDNVGIVVLLQANTPPSESNKDARMICVANTHLLFNKKRGDIKLAQLAYLIAEVDSLAMVHSDGLNEVYCPVILCGDLNSLPYSPLHHFLTTGRLDYGNRSASVISGQLKPTELMENHKKRTMSTPLLPWHFGMTMDCQWRHQQKPKEGIEVVHAVKDNEDSVKELPLRKDLELVNPENYNKALKIPLRGEFQEPWDSANDEEAPRQAPKGVTLDLVVSENDEESPQKLRKRPSQDPLFAKSDDKEDSKKDKTEGEVEENSANNSLENERKEHEATRVMALPFEFQSVYKHRFDDGTPEVTTCHSKACCNVDYIFYTLGIREKQSRNKVKKKYKQKGILTLLGRLELLHKSKMDVVKRLPNHQFSSDHLSLQAMFKLS